jgi:uncharacterized membrane protein YkvA (DUF1232 family)
MRSVFYLIKHPAVPMRLKLLPLMALLYFIFPRDLLMDFRPGGFIDDFVVISVLLSIFAAKAAPYVNPRRKEKDESIPVDFEVKDRVDGSATNPSSGSAEAGGTSDGENAGAAAGGPPDTDLRGREE